MRKCSKKISVLIVLLGSLFINVKSFSAASTGALGISGSENQTINKSFSLEFGIVSNSGSVVASQGTVTVEDTSCVKLKELVYVNDSADTENNQFSFSNNRGKTGTFTLVKGNFETGSKACTTNVKITGGALKFTDNSALKNLTVTKKIVVGEGTSTPPTPTKSSDATLKGLTPSTGSLSPSFKSSTTSYTLEVDENTKSVNFNAVPNHNGAKATNTTCNLNNTNTTCKITVTAENGTKKEYEVKVTKKTNTVTPPKKDDDNSNNTPKEDEKKSSDADLRRLDVGGYTLSPSFKKNTTSYSMTVGKNINSVEVNAIANDKNANVKVTGNSGFKEGMNTISITVTAEDGTKKIYTVNVTKKGDGNTNTNKSNDNTLKNIEIKNAELKPSFDKNVSNYDMTVPNDVEKLDINAIANDLKAKVKITGNENLSVGMNTITIEVTAEDESIRYYTINVTKSENKSNNKLESLTVDGYPLSPVFDKNNFSYDITVPNDVNELAIKALSENKNAKVEIMGNKDLKEGNNAVLIKVTDEDGYSQYYTLNVFKKPKEEAKFLGLTWKGWLSIAGFLLLLGLLILVIILLKKHKHKEKMVKNDIKQAPVIEFKPEFNFGSKNGTDDDIVEEGGTLNQYTGVDKKEDPKEIEYVEEASYDEKPTRSDIYDYDEEEDEEDRYDEPKYNYSADETITKAEIVDAIHEAIATKDPEKLKLLLDQDELNQRKKKLKAKENQKRKKNYFDDYDDYND